MTLSDILPKRYLGATLQSYTPKSESQREAFDVVKGYCDGILANIEAGTGLTILGSVGSGKTHLAACIVRAAFDLRKSARFLSEDFLFDTLKSHWGDNEAEAKFLTLLQRVRLLVIDDFGTRKVSDYVSERYEAIINARYSGEIPTIITTNHPTEYLEEIYPRQMSRLKTNTVVRVIGPDGRVNG